LIKAAALTSNLIGTLNDVNKYFEKSNNPLQSTIDSLKNLAPYDGNGVLVFLEADI